MATTQPIDFTGYVSNNDPRLAKAPAPAEKTPAPATATPPTGAPNFKLGDTGSQFSFANLMQTAVDRQNTINPLIQNKNLLIKQLYDNNLSPDEIAKLPKELQTAVQGGDKSFLEMQIRLLNDGISGRANTLDQSVQFLTNTYEKSVQDAETKKQQALTNITDHIAALQTAGIDPTQYFSQLYGADYLKSLGIDLGGISGSSTSTGNGYSTANDGNPLNITLGSNTQKYVDSGQATIKEANGLKFLSFKDPAIGLQAGKDLLFNSPIYKNLTVDQALKKWSGGGYNGEIVRGKGVDPAAFIRDLPSDQQSLLIQAMAQREGSKIGSSQSTGYQPTLQEIQKTVPGLTQADYSLATQVVDGLLAPSELSKRASTYNKTLAAAQAYSQAKYGKAFNTAVADRNYKFANLPATQNTLNYLISLTGDSGAPGNLDELKNQSNNINRTNFPAINNAAAWLKLETGDPAIAAYYATATEVADQVAKILQGGTGGGGTSDAKLAQAAQLFQTGFSKAQLNAVIDALNPLLRNRAGSMVKDNPYLSDYATRLSIDSSKTTNSGDSGSTYKGFTLPY